MAKDGFFKITLNVPNEIGVESRGEVTVVPAKDLPKNIVEQCLVYGITQKWADSVSSGKDMQETWDKLTERMVAGEWRGKRAGGAPDPHAAYRRQLNAIINGAMKSAGIAKRNDETRGEYWDKLEGKVQEAMIAIAAKRAQSDADDLAAVLAAQGK